MLPFTASVDLGHVERTALKSVEADNAALQRQGHRWVYEWGLTHLNSDAVKSALEALDGEIERDDTLRARELLYKLARLPEGLSAGEQSVYDQSVTWLAELRELVDFPEDNEGIAAVSLGLRTQAVLSHLRDQRDWKQAKRVLARHFPNASATAPSGKSAAAERDRYVWLTSCLEHAQRKEVAKSRRHERSR